MHDINWEEKFEAIYSAWDSNPYLVVFLAVYALIWTPFLVIKIIYDSIKDVPLIREYICCCCYKKSSVETLVVEALAFFKPLKKKSEDKIDDTATQYKVTQSDDIV